MLVVVAGPERRFAESIKAEPRAGGLMLKPKRRSSMVASAAVFAALYAVLGAIPVSRLVLGSGFLTASKVIAPLGGMLFGPLVGGVAALLGDLVDIYAGQLSGGATALAVISADLAVVAVAGLAYSGRRWLAMLIPLLALAAYSVDPISVLFVGPVPFAWLHVISFGLLAVALSTEGRRSIGRLNPFFVGAVTLASLMSGQLVGTIVGQNLLVRVYAVYTVASWKSFLVAVFAAYPVERAFYAVAGSIVAIPVLRSLSRSRGAQSTAS